MPQFEMDQDDWLAVNTAIDVGRMLLCDEKITPLDIIGIGHALLALERLPKSSPGISCEFGICHRAGDEEFSEMRYISVRIDEEQFEISSGGSVYDRSVGGDSFSEPGYRLELGGYKNNECDLWNLKSRIQEYLNLGAAITVEDELANDQFTWNDDENDDEEQDDLNG